MLIALVLAAATPVADPLRFFSGHTRGDGQLKILLRARSPVAVRGTGRIARDGALELEQVVTEGATPPRTRRWRLRRTGEGRYEGTLTDARGPVSGEIDGARLHLRFTARSGFRVQQWLTFGADGRSADNLLQARRFGVIVATLRERIVKVD